MRLRESAKPLGVIRHNNEVPDRQRVQSTTRMKLCSGRTASPINILDQENVRPKEKKFEQRVLGCIKRDVASNDKPNAQFFGMDYDRIKQLKGKYMQPTGAIYQNNGAERFGEWNSQLNFEEEEAKFDRLFTEEGESRPYQRTLAREVPFQSAILTYKPDYYRDRQLNPARNRSPIERPLEEDNEPLQYRNEELRMYMQRLKHQYGAHPQSNGLDRSGNTESQATLARIEQINGSIEDKMKHLFRKIEQKEERKRQRKLVANASKQKVAELRPKQRLVESYIRKEDDKDAYRLIKAIESQMVFDIEFRKLRELIPKGELEAISKIVSEKEPALTADQLKVYTWESNPLQQSKSAERVVLEQLAPKLIQAYSMAQKNYRDKVLHHFPQCAVADWLKSVNVEKKESVNLADILTQLNLKVGGEYRNRDLVRIAGRISGVPGTKLLSCQALQSALSRESAKQS